MLRMVNLLTRMINFEATAGNVEEFMELIQKSNIVSAFTL